MGVTETIASECTSSSTERDQRRDVLALHTLQSVSAFPDETPMEQPMQSIKGMEVCLREAMKENLSTCVLAK